MEKITVPRDYAYCMADTACPLHDKCLRSKIWQQVKREPEACDSLPVINPLNPATHYATEQCTQYRTAEKLRYARGMVHLYRHVPKHLVTYVRSHVIESFSCRRRYYYARLGDYPISPAQQAAIKQAFLACGIEADPVYDRFVHDYCWD